MFIIANAGPFALYRWEALFKDWRLFGDAFLYTILLAIGSLIVAMLLGIFFGSLSAMQNKFLNVISRIYVEFFQNTPLLIQFIVVYYGFPLISPMLTFSTTTIAIICVGLYHGAYISEVVRSGIGAVPKGQFEAAYSQGFSYGKTMRYVVLPQAWRIMLPPLTNQIVNLIKNTSTVAIISGADVMFTANSWSSINLNYIPAFAVAGFLYFILCFPLANLARKLEENNKKAYTR
ncbi:His/Glu/Gln/Arg/opine family amino ABC transporter, permease, 3-TM region [Enterococcus haemoperoxidus ATCC BAA-382]|uniref:Amino acid ABC transporter permease n=1 Tax=Enterococcus haemoperoxidus ATCC BAA-382 TaxID=1158608 RepID=R2QPQ0_9ENTE|nr:amino acid ABC transporter permease [Enterococcus haemoperoxidus]EOH98462.1 His/Glu/Gln/Arg/opine family amino ABC transporter, permease, 3-TM region [Enterococcus haemoperoxidus ATCC BAA-382]EOT62355.1 amino acid ABC transporter permease [Enterococcus haemoperoxidus ATCC BAA-382]OJG55563.1 His/Glu/Gln/Arg/opine family amino ABC transporter, permease, 3-TM region [Enterococcus haemoperoxidus]